jgi:DNA-binding CsgD family transcriptional regulator
MTPTEPVRSARPRGGLEQRHVAVLQALASGLSTAETAEQLGIRPDQARADLVDAMRVLNARTKLEAILAAHRAGLLALDQEQPEGS